MIITKADGKVLCKPDKICRSWWSCAWGLMFSKRRSLVMIFPEPKKISLHMWFVFFPIDVILVDEKMRIVGFRKNFLPFSVWMPSARCKYVVEMPREKGRRVEVGERVEMK